MNVAVATQSGKSPAGSQPMIGIVDGGRLLDVLKQASWRCRRGMNTDRLIGGQLTGPGEL